MGKLYSKHIRSPQTQKDSSSRLVRSSGIITLVLVGLIAWALWKEDEPELERPLYANRQDCEADWGQNCEEEPTPVYGGNSTGGLHYFRGPEVRQRSYNPSRSIGTRPVTRGGFGSIGRSFSVSG